MGQLLPRLPPGPAAGGALHGQAARSGGRARRRGLLGRGGGPRQEVGSPAGVRAEGRRGAEGCLGGPAAGGQGVCRVPGHSDSRRNWWEKGQEEALQLVLSSSVLLRTTGLVLKQDIDQGYRISRAQWV